MSYDITTSVGKVRLIIGDTDATVFAEEEIEYFLTKNSSDVTLAAADAAEAWAAKYATNPDSEKIGDYAYTQKIVANMLSLANRLRETAAATPYLTWAELDLTGETASGDDS